MSDDTESYWRQKSLYIVSSILSLSAVLLSFRLVWWNGTRRERLRKITFCMATIALFLYALFYCKQATGADGRDGQIQRSGTGQLVGG